MGLALSYNPDRLKLIQQLKGLSASSQSLAKSVSRGSREDDATKQLIWALADIFEASTGKPAKLHCHHDEYAPSSEENNKPTGGFFRMVSCVFELIVPQKGPEAIASAIRRVIKVRGNMVT